MKCVKKFMESLRASVQTGRRALAMLLSGAVLLCTLPVARISASAAETSNNPGFRVIAYDQSARIEIPYVSGATNYKVYLSTVQNADADALNADNEKQKVFDSGYESYAYAVDGDNSITISPSNPYYFYLVTDGTLQSTFQANTRATADCYWTSPGVYDSGWYGDGSANTYTISTAAQLAGLAVLVNGLDGLTPTTFSGKTVNLTASLDLSAYLWTPIGTDSHLFSGIFDGKSNVASGLHTNDGAKKNQGLFGYSGGSSTIEDIGAVNGFVKGQTNVGGIVGMSQGSITNCYNTGTVIGTGGSIGGVAGTANTITNCYNTGAVSGAGDGVGGVTGEHSQSAQNCFNTGTVSGAGGAVGGITGYGDNKNTDCYNTGTVFGAGTSVGGIEGAAYYFGNVENCYNTGAVSSASSYVGGILGSSNGAYLVNSYNTGSVSGTGEYVGAFVGQNYGKPQNSYSACKVNNADAYTYYDQNKIKKDITDQDALIAAMDLANNEDFCASPTAYADGGVFSSSHPVNQGYPVLRSFGYTDDPAAAGFSPATITVEPVDGEATAGTDYGDGTCEHPYLIRNAYQMDLVRNYLGGSNSAKVFKLAVNIDLSPIQYGQTQNADGSWKPIGTSSLGYYYDGTFDGNGYSVSGIYIKSNGGYQGLFTDADSDSTIENVGVTNDSITSTGEYTSVGGVVGYSCGTVTSCYNTGAVNGTGEYAIIGGVVGNSNSAITSCYNTGAVSGTGRYVGGVVGYSDSTNKIKNCYNTGAVSGNGSYSAVGGVVGISTTAVTSCYNTGVVNGNGSYSTVGGVVGSSTVAVTSCYNTGTVTGIVSTIGGIVGCSSAEVKNCYNIGAVSGNVYVGGIVGNNGGTLSYNYYSGASGGVGQVGGAASDVANGTIPFVSCANPGVGESKTIKELAVADLNADFKAAFGITAIQYPDGYESSDTGILTVSGKTVTRAAAGNATVTGEAGANSNAKIILSQNALNMTNAASGFSGVGTAAVSGPVTVVFAGQQGGVPVINTASALPGGTLNTPYSQTLTAAGTAPITWALASGSSLPAGLTLSNNGVISGTPTAAGSYSFTVTATNGSGQTTENMSIQINAASSGAPVINTASALPNGTLNTSYSQTLTAAGTAPITWALASGSSLPAGLTLSANGIISGTPTKAGSYSFTVTATNSNGQTTENMSIQITGGGTPGSSATVTGFDSLIGAVKNQTASVGAAVASLNLPQKLKVAVDGMGELWVKVSGWVSNTFNSSVFSKVGTYIFTPVLDNAYHDSGYVDSGYTVANNIAWPSITVTVQNNSSGGHSSSTGSSSSSSAASTQTTQTQVDTASNTATVTTVPDSVTNAGGTAQISVTVPSVTGGAGGTLDPGKAGKVTISLPESAMVQQLNAKQNVDLTLSVPSSVAHQTNGNTAIDIPVGSDVFNAAKANGSDLVINIRDTDTQKLAYTWTFKGSDLAKSTTPVTDVNIGMAIRLTTEVPQVNRLTPNNTGLVLMFDHSGPLPSTASLTFSAKEKGFKPGQKLYFYFYNSSAGQLESQAQEYTVDADGNVTVQISHCSNYVLLPNKARTITLDTRVYTMPVGDSYITGVKLTGVSGTKLKVYSSTKGVADVTALSNGNVKAKALKTGLTYVMIDVYDSKNKFLTHASVRLIVKEVKPNGNSARQFGIF